MTCKVLSWVPDKGRAPEGPATTTVIATIIIEMTY